MKTWFWILKPAEKIQYVNKHGYLIDAPAKLLNLEKEERETRLNQLLEPAHFDLIQ